MWLTLAPTNMVKGSLIPRIPEPWLLLELVHFRKWIWSSQQDILNWLVCKLSSSDLKILRTRARLDNYLSIVIKITLNRQFKFCLHMYHLNVSSHGQVMVFILSWCPCIRNTINMLAEFDMVDLFVAETQSQVGLE